MSHLAQFGPSYGNFLKFRWVRNVTFHITALGAHIVIQRRNGSQTDRDGIASEGSGLELDVGTAIYLGRTALGAFSLFQFSPLSSKKI